MTRSRIALAGAVAVAAVAVAGLRPTPARACASCNCGDPTLTALGVEKPFRNRVRLALDESFGGTTVGESAAREQAWTLRSALAAAWSPTPRLTVGALVPVVSVWMQSGGRAWKNATGLGDSEVSVRGVAFRDRAFSPRHLFWLGGGLKLPTAPRVYDDEGYPFPEDDQPGSGSWDPFALATYGWFGGPVSVFSSASVRYATPGRRGYRRGMSVGATAGVQLQPGGRVAFGLSSDVRWAAPDVLPTGADAPNSGGTMLAVTPSVLVSPVTNWLIRVSYQIHVVDWLHGAQSAANTLFLSTVVDLN